MGKIKLEFEFDTSDLKECQTIIDASKWKKLIGEHSTYLLFQSAREDIPEQEQVIYNRVRNDLNNSLRRSGLIL